MHMIIYMHLERSMKLLEKFKERARRLKDEIQVLIVAYRDERTPLMAKLIIGITVAYMLSPIDLIPDFIPVLGLLDDLIIVPLLIAWSIRLIPKSVIEDARQELLNRPVKYKKHNWVFASVIIGIWILLIFFIARLFIKD